MNSLLAQKAVEPHYLIQYTKHEDGTMIGAIPRIDRFCRHATKQLLRRFRLLPDHRRRHLIEAAIVRSQGHLTAPAVSLVFIQDLPIK